jgi:hypothetical protein
VVLMGALPSGANAPIFAQRYETHEAESATAIVLSTFCYAFTLPAWLFRPEPHPGRIQRDAFIPRRPDGRGSLPRRARSIGCTRSSWPRPTARARCASTDYCGSQHAYRGGGSTRRARPTPPRVNASARGTLPRPPTLRASEPSAPRVRDPFPVVAERECADPALIVEVPMHGPVELESLLRRIIARRPG